MAVDRIGTGMNAQLMLAQIRKAEIAMDESNRQVVTGKVADTYSGFGNKTAILESARSASERADGNVAVAQQVVVRLDLQDAQLTQLSDLIGEVRKSLTKAVADQDATSMMTNLDGLFSQAVEILNAKDANGYIYGGDNNQTPPVTVSTLADLAALPSVAQAFANGNTPSTARLGDVQTVQVGILASDLGTELFSLFRQVAQFDLGANGPLVAKTTPAQQSFLETTIQTSIDAAAAANQQTAANGIRYRMVQNTLTRLQANSTVYKGFVSNIEDVDMPEALSNLNQNQIALQASFQIASTLNRLSLLDYLK